MADPAQGYGSAPGDGVFENTRHVVVPGVEDARQARSASERLSAILRARALFKFIIGIGNLDPDQIRFLTQAYGLAGADIIDVAARPDLVGAARAALTEVRRRCPDPPATIMASMALEHDPHVAGAGGRPEHRALIVPADTSALVANVKACLEAGAEAVELHASNSEDRELAEAVAAVSTVLEGRYLSVCLGTEGFPPPRVAIRQTELVLALHGPATMIQAEGIGLGKNDAPGSSVQGLALAQVLLARTSAYVVVAGGANRWTRHVADFLGIEVHGIASGSYARHLVEGLMPGGPGLTNLDAAARVAGRFARHAKGAPDGDV